MYTWYRRVRRNGRITKGFSLRGRAVKAGAGVWKESRKEFDVAVDGGSAITAVLPGHSLPFCLTCIRGSYTIDYFHRLFFFSRSLFLRRSFTAVVREDSRGDWGGGGGSLSRFEGGSIGIDADRFDSIAFSFKLYTMENGIWNIISFYLLVLAYSRRNLSFIDIVRVVLSSHETNDASSILSFFFFLSLIFRYIIII